MRYKGLLSFIILVALSPSLVALEMNFTVSNPSGLSCSENVRNLNDEQVDKIITEAEKLFKTGEKNLKTGNLNKAQENFDAAAEAIQMAGVDIESNFKLKEYFDRLLQRIEENELALAHHEEMAAQRYEPALIDEVGSVNLFRLKIDPKLRALVDQDLDNTVYSIPVTINDRVLQFLDYFQSDGRKRFQEGLRQSGRYMEMIERIFKQEDLPNDLIYMALVESSFNPLAYSRSRAKGIWQFIASTGKSYGLRKNKWIDERSDPEKSTRAAARYIKDLYNTFDDWHLVMAAYNAGEGAILRAIQRAQTRNFWELADGGYLPRETTNHVPAILASLIISKNPEKYGFQKRLDPPLRLEKASIGSATDLRVISKLIDVPVDRLKQLNPDLIGCITPLPYSDYQIKLPKGKGNVLSSLLAHLPAKQRLLSAENRISRRKALKDIPGTKILLASSHSANPSKRGETEYALQTKSGKIIHRVKRGENLYKIANLYNTTVDSVRDLNRLASEKLHPGDKITIFPGR